MAAISRRSFVGCAAAAAAACGATGASRLAIADEASPVQPGDLIAMGTYAGNPIEWRVLTVEDGNALLFATQVLSARPLCDEYTEEYTWENSNMRSWLNGEFLDGFTPEEIEKIQAMRLENPANATLGTPGCSDTVDRVFLLSVDEAQTLVSPEDFDGLVYQEPAAADFEAWTVSRGPSFGVTTDVYSVDTLLGQLSPWITRTPGESPCMACGFAGKDVLFTGGHAYHCMGVRPAMWIALGEPSFETVEFGSYPQGAQGEIEPIEWLVLDERDGKKLLLSKKCLDSMPYSETYGAATWDACQLRSWLNGTFFEEAFSQDEQSLIVPTALENPASVDFGAEAEKATEDTVFVLTYDDVATYLGAPASSETLQPYGPATAVATAYAAQQGVRVNPCTGASSWWLRTPGDKPNHKATVLSDGRLSVTTDDANVYIGVRPALWAEI